MGCSVTASQKMSVFGSETSAACSCRSLISHWITTRSHAVLSALEASFEAVEARL